MATFTGKKAKALMSEGMPAPSTAPSDGAGEGEADESEDSEGRRGKKGAMKKKKKEYSTEDWSTTEPAEIIGVN